MGTYRDKGIANCQDNPESGYIPSRTHWGFIDGLRRFSWVGDQLLAQR
jgi:hypothetical protein